MLGSYGAAGQSLERIAAAVDQIQAAVGGATYAVNLIHSPSEPAHEMATAELLLQRGVPLVEASAYLDLTPAIVRYRVAGFKGGVGGMAYPLNRVVGKVSRVEVATKFLSPPPERVLKELVAAGHVTATQAQLAARFPVADDVTVEADSGGHTDNRPAITLLPTILALRDRLQAQFKYAVTPRIGLAGGVATPASVAAGFAMGAAYVVTGSVNQACVESGSSTAVRKMLAEAGQADVTMAPAADMFEMGVKLQVLKRGSIGILATNRDVAAASGGGSNQAVGVDAGLAFRNSWTMDGAYVKSASSRVGGDGTSYWTRVDFAVDRYGAQYEHLYVGPGFNPEVGFLRRLDFRRNFGQLRFSPRLSRTALRQIHHEVSLDYVTDPTGRLETRVLELSHRGDFRGGDQYEVKYLRDYEFLARPFAVATGVTIPVGGYTFQEVQNSFTLGPQRRVNGRIGLTRGQFFDGDRTEVSYSGRAQASAALMFEPAVSVNWVQLPYGDFRNVVARTRAIYTMSPRAFFGALVQYASATHSVTTNVRFRWEYRPGSDLFIVYSEGRDTDPRGLPGLQNRGVVVKFTRLFRF